MQHVRYPNVFALGDAGSSPNSKTGAAIRKQAPVVVREHRRPPDGRPLTASYDGYASCPIVTSSHDMLLAEFDYDLNLKPSFPVLDPTKPHRAYWYLKKYGLPFMYWNLMLKGRPEEAGRRDARHPDAEVRQHDDFARIQTHGWAPPMGALEAQGGGDHRGLGPVSPAAAHGDHVWRPGRIAITSPPSRGRRAAATRHFSAISDWHSDAYVTAGGTADRPERCVAG